MTTLPCWPDHLLSLAEWDALPEDTSRHHELVEGVVVVDRATPSTVRAPDVVVRPETIDDRLRYDAGDLLAVVEVLSPGSRRTDRVAKLYDHAEAGIGCFLVEPGPPTTLIEFRLRGAMHERVAEHSGTARLSLDGVTVVVDLAGMLEP